MAESKFPDPPYPQAGTTGLLFEIILAIGLERLVNTYFPGLQPYVWLVIAAGLTWKFLNLKPLRKGFVLAYSRWGTRHRMATYILISLIGAAFLSFYWWGIGRTFASLEQQKLQASNQTNSLPSPSASATPSASSTPLASPSPTPAASVLLTSPDQPPPRPRKGSKRSNVQPERLEKILRALEGKPK